MKCQAFVRLSPKAKKVRLVSVPYTLSGGGTVMTRNSPKNSLANLLKGTVICGGEIECSVRAADEPYYGGTSAVLEVEIKCKRCGNTFWGADRLHQSVDVEKLLSVLLQKYVSGLPDIEGLEEATEAMRAEDVK